MSALFQINSKRSQISTLLTQGRLIEAALVLEEAIEIAERHSLDDEIPDLLSSASAVWSAAGESRKALNALLRIRDSYSQNIGVDLEGKIQEQSFNLMFKESPDLDLLEARVRDMEQLNQSNGDTFRGVLCDMRNSLFSARGMWAEALAEKETQWANRDTDSSCEVCTLAGLVADSLDASDRDKAESWIEKMRLETPNLLSCRSNMCIVECDFALCYLTAMEAERAAEKADELFRQMSGKNFNSTNLRVRAWLLNDRFGDPLAPTHPAHELLTRRTKRPKTLAEKRSYAILSADFRLASLRYAAGCMVVDDSYYKCRQETRVTPMTRLSDELDIRVKRARRAINRIRQSARALDQAFRCTWRMERVKEREERLDSIIATFTQT